MENPRIKKGLGVTIVLLFLLTTCIPVLASEGKPDLIVSFIGFVPYGDSGRKIVAAATIENIGDTKATGTLYLEYTFSRLIFGTITNTDTVCMFGGLEPGEFTSFEMIYQYELPKFGFFEFKCTVNPGGEQLKKVTMITTTLHRSMLPFLANGLQ